MRLHYTERRAAPLSPGAPALELRHLTAAHPGRQIPAIQGITLAVNPGELVALVGPNGSGKSTILKSIVGLIPAIEGEIRIFGLPPGACPQRIAYLPQRGEIDWRFPMSVERLVTTGRYVHLGWLRRPTAQDRKHSHTILARLGLADLADRQIGELSGGQQQRALLARALVQDAELLLLDEPTNAVDAETRDIIADVLDELRDQGRTALVATHDLERLTDFDRVIALRDGRLATDRPGMLYLPEERVA